MRLKPQKQPQKHLYQFRYGASIDIQCLVCAEVPLEASVSSSQKQTMKVFKWPFAYVIKTQNDP